VIVDFVILKWQVVLKFLNFPLSNFLIDLPNDFDESPSVQIVGLPKNKKKSVLLGIFEIRFWFRQTQKNSCLQILLKFSKHFDVQHKKWFCHAKKIEKVQHLF
jgi:hypothetical protein